VDARHKACARAGEGQTRVPGMTHNEGRLENKENIASLAPSTKKARDPA
jgi:hypothetical protein